MSVSQRSETRPGPSNGEQQLIEGLETLARAYGNRFLLEPPPTGSRSATWRRS